MNAIQCPYCGIVYGEEDGHDPEECYKFCLQELTYISEQLEEATNKVIGAFRILNGIAGNKT